MANKSSVVCVVLLLLCVVAVAIGVVDATGVVRLREDSYEATLQRRGPAPWIVRFCTPKAAKCKEHEAEFAKLATLVTEVQLGDVNCASDSDICLDFGIKKKYPTLILLPQGSLDGGVTYKGADQTADAWAAWVKHEMHGDVIPLTTADFATSVAEGNWLVEFWAPWCGHCREFAPEYRQIASAAKDFKVAQVNCENFPAICQEQSVKGFPTLKLFSGGNSRELRGTRSKQSVLFEVEQLLLGNDPYPEQPPITDVDDPANSDSDLNTELG
eukprot:TRINITY_DN10121_c0_g1_i1.p1 TRINITY_DN10121_c0_g1~~TRINITY_DN10121_c0_g1_i1.p1  ORF type:complete len:271 (-),score=34.81 TRINITY_DN10121_c0_g1_i1:18-830(-)